MLEEPRRLFAMQSDAYWIDIGSPENYVQAHLDLLDGALGGGRRPDAREVAPGVWASARPRSHLMPCSPSPCSSARGWSSRQEPGCNARTLGDGVLVVSRCTGAAVGAPRRRHDRLRRRGRRLRHRRRRARGEGARGRCSHGRRSGRDRRRPRARRERQAAGGLMRVLVTGGAGGSSGPTWSTACSPRVCDVDVVDDLSTVSSRTWPRHVRSAAGAARSTGWTCARRSSPDLLVQRSPR